LVSFGIACLLIPLLSFNDQPPLLLSLDVGLAFTEGVDTDGDGIDDSNDTYPDANSIAAAIEQTRARGMSGLNDTELLIIAGEIWSDADGDGWADQAGSLLTDHCPNLAGPSYRVRNGCGDMDLDGLPDEMDQDADGDGISNDYENAASTGTYQYLIYDSNSTPSDNDFDGIPDVIDNDDDNDGWSDEVEMERGSDSFDEFQTPFNLYGGINTGVFYSPGHGFSYDADSGGFELSISWIVSALTTELIIPLGLIPIYLTLWGYRRRNFLRLEKEIESSEDAESLHQIEQRVNVLVREKKLKTFQGLVLRNAIELREVELNQESGLNNVAADESE